MEIRDDGGDLVDRFEGTETEWEAPPDFSFFRARRSSTPTVAAGLNRFSWNGRYQGAAGFEGMILWSARAASGPKAPPGEYEVTVLAGGSARPRPSGSPPIRGSKGVTTADLEAQFELASRIRDRTSQANEAVVQIRDVRAQLDERLEGSSDSGLLADGGALIGELTEVEEALYQTKNRSNQDPLNFPIRLNNRLASLRRSVETGGREADRRRSCGLCGALRRARWPSGAAAHRPRRAPRRSQREPRGASRWIRTAGGNTTPGIRRLW